MKPCLSVGKSTELHLEWVIESPEAKGPVARAASASGNGPSAQTAKLPSSWLGPTSEKEKAILSWQPSGCFSGRLSGEECWLPTVTPSGGHRGQDRCPSWLQLCDTQQMMQVAEGIRLPEVFRLRFAMRGSMAASWPWLQKLAGARLDQQRN